MFCPCSLHLRNHAGQPGNCRLVKEGSERQLHLEFFAYPGNDLCSQKGMPPQIEEIGMDPDLVFKAKDRCPDLRQYLLGGSLRKDNISLKHETRRIGRRKSIAVYLPIGRER